MRLPLLCLCLLLLSLPSCRKPAASVLHVGQYVITPRDIELKNRVVRVYYPQEKRNLGEELLEKAFLYAEILRNNGRPLSSAVIKEEEDRIDRTTLMPEMLGRIKAVFEGDQEAYRRLYVMPTLVERAIYYDLFLHDPRIQAESRNKVMSFIDAAKKEPKQFTRIAARFGGTVRDLRLEPDGELKWLDVREKDAPEPSPSSGDKGPVEVQRALAKRGDEDKHSESWWWRHDVAAKRKPGSLHPEVVDRGESWMAVRYLSSPKKRQHLFQTATFPKADYGVWLEAEKAKVAIRREAK